MSAADIIILSAIAIAVLLAMRHNIKRRKSGKCACGCSNCSATCALKNKIGEK